MMKELAVMPSYASDSILSGSVSASSKIIESSHYRAMAIEERSLEIEVPPQDLSVLVIAMSLRQTLWTDLGGIKRTMAFRPGEFLFIPAGYSSWWYTADPQSTVFHVHLERSSFACVEDENEGRDIRPILPRSDILLAGAADALMRDQDISRPGKSLFRDAIGLIFANRILETGGGLRIRPAESGRSGLAPWQLRRTIERISADLRAEPALSELAANVGLSAFHFARAFKVSTGIPPHAYLVRLRVDRARDLLVGSTMTITEIAAHIGYDDPGYLARLFRKHLGVTPMAYRRERKL